MGKRRYRSFSNAVLPEKQWQDLIILTALLLGAGAESRPYLNPEIRTFDYPQAHRWQRMQKWLWRVHNMHVRADGSIYHKPEPSTAEVIDITLHRPQGSNYAKAR